MSGLERQAAKRANARRCRTFCWKSGLRVRTFPWSPLIDASAAASGRTSRGHGRSDRSTVTAVPSKTTVNTTGPTAATGSAGSAPPAAASKRTLRPRVMTPPPRQGSRRDAEGNSYPWIVRDSRVVTQWYFYCHDSSAGPFFLKYCGYFPYNAKLCCNGNEYAKAMAAGAGIGFTALDNGFAAVDDVAAVQAICDSFDEKVIWDLAAKWMAILPCPFTADDTAAGYRYEVSVLQAEFSLTQVLDEPVTGRIFFEQLIRDNLDIGRPDQVGLIFARRIIRKGPRATPGRFRTRVITEGVVPTLHIDYKHSKIKQYHKEGKALRTETTINDSRDFGIGKRLDNLPALRTAGFAATRRLLDVEKLSHDPADGQAAITR